MNVKKLAAALTMALSASFTMSAYAEGECVVHYTRAACPGKDAESFAKCDGKASCDKKVNADTPEACQAAALKACANDRLDITKSKIIGAHYKGSVLKSATGKEDFCADYDKRSAEFDRCPQ